MKGRYCIAVCTAAVALLFMPGPGSSQTAGNFRGLPTENKQVLGSLQQPSDANIEQIHVVRRGDTLARISQIFDTTPEAQKS
jgi:LysM repeat protein